MKLKLKDILPNPNRDFVSCPLKPEKQEELKRSIHETGFWENVVVRKSPTVKGAYELAYGHNRLQAAIDSGIEEADFIVKPFSEELMIKVMDNENREAYGTDLLSVMESVQAVVNALADGRIAPFVQAAKTREDTLRYAPSFIPGKSVSGTDSVPHPYSIIDVALFLGRTRKRTDRQGEVPADVVTAAFAVLELEEHKVPGWSRKELLKKYKTLKTIPVDAILQDATSAKQMARKRFEAEQREASTVKSQGKEVQETLSKLLAESLAAEAEEKRIAEEYAAAAKEKNVAEAKRLKAELKEKEEEDKERDKRIAEAKKEEKRAAKEEAKSEKKAQDAEKRNAERAEKSWLNFNETLIGNLNRTFNESSGLYAELSKWRTDSRTTEAQRAAMQLALRDLSARAANFNPYTGPTKAVAKGGKRK